MGSMPTTRPEEPLTVAQQLEIAVQALKVIRERYGQVCSPYEICSHRACESSYGAWATADAALKRLGAYRSLHVGPSA
jgi:hypothetical protein